MRQLLLICGSLFFICGSLFAQNRIVRENNLTDSLTVVRDSITALRADIDSGNSDSITVHRDSLNNYRSYFADSLDIDNWNKTGTGLTYKDTLTILGNIVTGYLKMVEDGGLQTLIDMSVTDTPADNVAQGYNIKVDGVTVATFQALADGNGIVDNPTVTWAGSGTVSDDLDVVDDFSAGGTLFFVDDSEGRVGIATVTPEATLHINGSTFFPTGASMIFGETISGSVYDGEIEASTHKG